MGKIRVYQLARKLGMTTRELLQELEELGIPTKSHMSYIDEETVSLLMELFEEEEKTDKTAKTEKKEKRKKEEEETEELEEKRPRKKGNVVYIESEDELKLDRFAQKIGKSQTQIIQDLFVKKGVPLKPGQKLEEGILRIIEKVYDIKIAFKGQESVESAVEEEDDYEKLEKYFEKIYHERKEELVFRPPIVTVMGHVDHGKTTLLDYIRNTNVAEREEGRITQSIGAYQVVVNGKKITFIDTPGHEVFTEMRARGAQVTDIVVLVVAADDGVMPQTIEAYNHAKSAGVPVIVAINKIDKPNANVNKTKQDMVEKLGLVPEDWGGDTITVPMSAKKGIGVEDLLEMILLLAEMREIRCYPKPPARAVIIESKLDKNLGPVANAIVKDGILRVGDYVVAGHTFGRVRALIDDRGKRVKEAEPSKPVMVLGFEDVPDPHSVLYVVKDRETAEKIANKQKEKLEKMKRAARRHVRLEDLFKMMEEKEKKVLNLVVKADTQGSAAALRNAIEKLRSEEIDINIVHMGVGAVNASDIMLAAATDAVVLGFRVKADSKARKQAEVEGVQLKLYSVIYKLIDDLKKALEGMLEPEEVEEYSGRGEIRKVFKISKVGKVAGVQLIDGFVERSGFVRIYREGSLIFEGKLESLKHYKDDASRVDAPQECGMKFEGFDDIKEGDELEFYIVKKVPKKLTFISEEESGK
ncbi:MAG: translation initiation factor IF-2 [Thermotogaceae bacterium]|nr:translation initiation factor IF-2 [Thermotogaceae bacterium]